jgi:hypothetical protein
MSINFRRAIVGAAILGATAAGSALAASAITNDNSSTVVSSVVADTPTTVADSGTSVDQSGTTADQTPPAPDNDGDGPHGRGPRGPGGSFDPSKGGHVANGITEAVLTGDAATKVTAAAETAVPGGTIERVENDAEGAVYEAHVVKADGSHVTVKFNADYSVATIETMGH